jgi:hypothetical protein
MKIKLISLIAGLVAVAAGTSAYAQNVGLLGTTYASAGVSYSHDDIPGRKVDLWGFGAGVNYGHYRDGDFGFDIGGSLGFGVDGKNHITIQEQNIGGYIRPYYVISPEFKVFAIGQVGYLHSRIATAAGKHSDDNAYWNLGGGVEYVIDQFSIVGTAAYQRLTNGGDGVWSFGGSVNYWIDSTWGVGAGYSYLDLSTGHGNEVTANVRYRF